MRVLVTAGPTRERIDTVRYISNRSSGRMGYALASVAAGWGHDVTLISGSVSLEAVPGTRMIYVETAAEMLGEVLGAVTDADVVVMCAAVSDYRPVTEFPGKLKKTDRRLILELERTEDILGRLGRHERRYSLVGFAAETENVLDNARAKLKSKNLDWIVANNVGIPGRGFDSEENAVTMISRKGEMHEFGLQSKSSLAVKILSTVFAGLGDGDR